MTRDEKMQLAQLLESLADLDRFADCSDRYFRQVFVQRIRTMQAFGYADKLRADAEDTDE